MVSRSMWQRLNTCQQGNPIANETEWRRTNERKHFKYLGSVIDKDGTIGRDVDLRVRAAWSSWRKFTGVLYDRNIPRRLKANVYEAIIRPALTYGSECWAMEVTNKRKIATTDMRMLRGIIGVSRRDHMVWPYPETRCKQRHSQSDGPDKTRNQTTRTSRLPRRHGTTDEGRHDGRGYYPICGHRPEGVEKKDKADP